MGGWVEGGGSEGRWERSGTHADVCWRLRKRQLDHVAPDVSCLIPRCCQDTDTRRWTENFTFQDKQSVSKHLRALIKCSHHIFFFFLRPPGGRCEGMVGTCVAGNKIARLMLILCFGILGVGFNPHPPTH